MEVRWALTSSTAVWVVRPQSSAGGRTLALTSVVTFLARAVMGARTAGRQAQLRTLGVVRYKNKARRDRELPLKGTYLPLPTTRAGGTGWSSPGRRSQCPVRRQPHSRR